eukprot:CAMPEP_0116982190 /NCGR_PEP_ID=MMETSP0467-20121206/60185_1 /TAXON_ID=283647 /ORGANISM="Mesodinium pulex, Strain SPMC105" /LENGTH=36 /DNA_ID= /DNA_START= /DNA_END= /DNA_ORIENTATION=
MSIWIGFIGIGSEVEAFLVDIVETGVIAVETSENGL